MKTMNCSGVLLCLFLLLSPLLQAQQLKPGTAPNVIDGTKAITSVNGKITSIVNLTTNDIPESVNLYYTDARSRATFSAGTGISLSGAGIISAFNTTTSWNPYNPGSTSN